tara:strand:+ start:10404 stop:11108 length:705 start_codon:yes stop_codon:yes gene_type:complete
MSKKGSQIRYLNFPIQMLGGFLLDSKGVLDDIMDYSVYAHSVDNLEFGNEEEAFSSSAKYFGIKFGNIPESIKNGEAFYDSLGSGNPMVGIDVKMVFDYYKNHKTDFQKACLLGYLAIRSILMDKAYCKTTNDNWFSRMDGKSSKMPKEKLSPEIQKFHKEYQAKKIKTELALSWNLKTYSRHTRGFYVSFKLELEDLVFHAEKKRKSYQAKKLKNETEMARLKALERLKNIDF